MIRKTTRRLWPLLMILFLFEWTTSGAQQINSLTVNEGSPYAVFTVRAVTGQSITLGLSVTGTGTGFAELGTDTGSQLEYWNGTSWVPYTAAFNIQGTSNVDPDACPGSTANDPFTRSRSIVSSFHGALYRTTDGKYFVSGERASALGDNMSTPKLVNSANGYNYTGTLIDVAAASGNAGYTQYAWLTTDGLYVWGEENNMVHGALTTSRAFQKITLPGSINPAAVKFMSGTEGGLALVMNDGSVWINRVEYASDKIRGNGTSSGSTSTYETREITSSFTQVKLNSTTLLSGITDLELNSEGAIALNRTTGKLYMWGNDAYLGNGTARNGYIYATEMPLPLGANNLPISVVQIQSAGSHERSSSEGQSYWVLGGDGRVYALGDNYYGQLGQGDKTDRSSWVVVKDASGTGFLQEVSFISGQNNSTNNHSISAVLNDGTLLSWGTNDSGMIGLGDTVSDASLPSVPLWGYVDDNGNQTLIPQPYPVYAVENGGHFTVAVAKGQPGLIAGVGHNIGGVFGDGSTDNRDAYLIYPFSGTGATLGQKGCITTAGETMSLLVRVAIKQDGKLETVNGAGETFKVTVQASPNDPVVTGICTILDDGNGDVYGSTNITGAPNIPRTGGIPSNFIADDDNPLPTVPDTNTGLIQIQISGNVSTNETVPAGTSYGPATLVSSPTGSAPQITVNSDGTYTFTGDLPGTYVFDVAVCKPGVTTDCQTEKLTITTVEPVPAVNNVTVNEGSPYAVFTLNVKTGLNLTLALDSTGTGSGFATLGDDTGTQLEYWNGTSWVPYTAPFTISGTSNIDYNACGSDPLAGIFEKSRAIVSTYHGALYRTTDGRYFAVGEYADPLGAQRDTFIVPKLVTPANGYNYSGTLIDVAAGSGNEGSSQYAWLTTAGLYIWGFEGNIIHEGLTTSGAFQKITLPAGITLSDIKSLSATEGGLALLMKNGSIWINRASTRSGAMLRGNGENLDTPLNEFTQVKTDANTVLTGITDLEMNSDGGFAFNRTTGKLYNWGRDSYLGDGSARTNRPYATLMTFPTANGTPVSIAQIQTSGARTSNGQSFWVLGSDKRIYALGDNVYGQLGQGDNNERTSWVVVKDTTGAAMLEDVMYISGQNSSTDNHSISAVLKDGTLLSWGLNSGYFTLGIADGSGGSAIGEATLPSIPQWSNVDAGGNVSYVPQPAPVYAVENGGHFTAAIVQSQPGLIAGVGHNIGGVFGDGTTKSRDAYLIYPFKGQGATMGQPACVTNPGEDMELLVRVAIKQDAPLETIFGAGETFKITAQYTATGPVATGIGTILDNGEGDVFGPTNRTGTSDIPGTGGIPTSFFPDNDSPLATDPDINATYTNVPVTGDVSTNEELPPGNTYGTPVLTSSPSASTPQITMNADGTYTFTGDKPGVYVYEVPVCKPGITQFCQTETLTITVIEMGGNNPPIANTDLAATLQETPVTLKTLANDQSGTEDKPLNPASIQVTVAPLNGTTSVNTSTGDITYTPAAGFTGVDYYTYQVCDTSNPAQCTTAIQEVIVTNAEDVNTTTAADDYNSTWGQIPAKGNLLINDLDAQGDNISATPQEEVIPEGTFTLLADGTYTFVPKPGFTGPVNIPYTICDDNTNSACASATLYILVSPGESDPDISATFTNVAIKGDVSTNDAVPAATTYGTPAPVSKPDGAIATITLKADGTYDFKADKPGVYVYDVPVCAATVTTGCPTEKLVITVLDKTGDPNAPVANIDIAYTAPSTSVTLYTLSNDGSGGLGRSLDPYSVDILEYPANGSVSVDPVTGNITYTPDSGFTGVDVYTYTVCDDGNPVQCTEAVQEVTVVANTPGVNQTQAADDFALGSGDQPVFGNLLTNDTDAQGDNQTVTPQTLTLNEGSFTLAADGSWTFDPIAGFSGPLNVPYTVCDDGTPSVCADATLYILIRPFEPQPDVNATFVNSTINGKISTNDQVFEGAVYSIESADPSNPSGGNLTVNPDGTYSFTSPNPGVYKYYCYVCQKEITVSGRKSDSSLSGQAQQTLPCGLVLLTITVLDPFATDNPPIANTDIASTLVDTPVALKTISNDFAGSPGVALVTSSVALVSQPANGTVSVNTQTGDITYTPAAGFTGVDEYSYKICDNQNPSKCTTSTQKIIILDPDAPNTTLAADDFTYAAGPVPVTGNLLTNDSDPQNQAQTTVPQNITRTEGTFVLNANGTYTFTPVLGFSGQVEIPYTACDNGTPQACANATLYILVSPASIDAVNNDFTSTPVNGYTGGTAGNIYPNDLVNGSQLLAADVTRTLVNNGGITGLIIQSNGDVIVPAGTPAGTYTITYRICQVRVPAICDEAIVTILVNPPDILATTDDLTASPISNEKGGIAGNIFPNDELNNTVIDGEVKSDVTITLLNDGGLTGVTIGDDGAVTVPKGTVPGTYTLHYKICDNLNPTNCSEADVLILIEQTELLIPDGLSPNGDGLNDVFYIEGLSAFPDNEIMIFNRWGNKVYEAKPYRNNWDGTSNNSLTVGSAGRLPAGTYFYVLKLNDKKHVTGYIYIAY